MRCWPSASTSSASNASRPGTRRGSASVQSATPGSAATTSTASTSSKSGSAKGPWALILDPFHPTARSSHCCRRQECGQGRTSRSMKLVLVAKRVVVESPPLCVLSSFCFCVAASLIWKTKSTSFDFRDSDLFFSTDFRDLWIQISCAAANTRGGSRWAIGAILPRKPTKIKFIYHNFVQFWKQVSRQYETLLPNILEIAPPPQPYRLDPSPGQHSARLLFILSCLLLVLWQKWVLNQDVFGLQTKQSLRWEALVIEGKTRVFLPDVFF